MTITDVKAANAAAGRFFFSRDTMKFFKSKIESGVLKGRGKLEGRFFFLTSDEMPDRKITIREIIDGGAEIINNPFDKRFALKESAKSYLKELCYPEG